MTTSEQYGTPPPPARKATGGVIALGVCSIGYAAMFRLCCGFGSLVMALFSPVLTEMLSRMGEMQGTPMPSFEGMLSGPMRAYGIIGGFVFLILGTFLLAGGIGLLRLRPWARNLLLGVAAAEIVWALMNFAITIFFVNPRMREMMGEELAQTPQMVVQVIGAMFSVMVRLVFPVVLLVCLNLKSIKGQFESEWEQAMGGPQNLP